jgi:hypothetical protein
MRFAEYNGWLPSLNVAPTAVIAEVVTMVMQIAKTTLNLPIVVFCLILFFIIFPYR